MWRVLIVVVLAFLWSPPASACDCSNPTAAIPVKSSELEVWGVATRVVQSATGHLVRLKVYDTIYDKNQKAPAEIVVQDPTYCGVGFEEGKAYFVRGLEMRQENVYLTNSCAQTRELAAPPGIAEEAHPSVERVADSPEEAELNRAATKAAQTCKSEIKGRQFRTFVLTVAPDDDPLVLDLETSVVQSSNCVGEQMFSNVAAVQTARPLIVSGAALLDGKPRGIVDLWTCSGADCPTFSATLRDRLLDVVPPLTEAQARTLAKQMHSATDGDPSVEIARTLCPIDGLDAAEKFAQNNKLVGGPRWNRELQAMLFECAFATRKLEDARLMLQTTNPGPAFAITFDWLSGRDTELTLPIRVDAPTLDDEVDGSFLNARRAFMKTEMWENDPVMLEAFAETVAADPNAPMRVKELGALAYHKAALLEPDVAPRYLQFARELATDEELGETLATLRSNYQQAIDRNEARASLAQRAAAEPVEQIDLEVKKEPVNTRRAPILKDEPDDGLDLDWGSLALHLLVIVGALSVVAFLASRGARRR